MKIEVVIDYPTLRNLSTVPNYLNLLFSGGNIIKEQNKEMQQKFSQLERAHETLIHYLDNDPFWIQATHHIMDLANSQPNYLTR